MKVEISPTARQQLLALAAWWGENRPAARVRVEDALEKIRIVVAWSALRGAGPELS